MEHTWTLWLHSWIINLGLFLQLCRVFFAYTNPFVSSSWTKSPFAGTTYRFYSGSPWTVCSCLLMESFWSYVAAVYDKGIWHVIAWVRPIGVVATPSPRDPSIIILETWHLFMHIYAKILRILEVWHLTEFTNMTSSITKSKATFWSYYTCSALLVVQMCIIESEFTLGSHNGCCHEGLVLGLQYPCMWSGYSLMSILWHLCKPYY